MINNIDINKIDTGKSLTSRDYSLNNSTVSIKIMSVNYDKSYNSIVSFNSKKEQDEYFNNADGHVINGLNYSLIDKVKNSNQLTVDVPFNIADNYNYLVIDVDNENIPSNSSLQFKQNRYFYFIDNVSMDSPNSTRLQLTQDVWMTKQFNIEIGVSTLEQSHYAMAKGPTPEEFLSDRIQNIKMVGYPEKFSPTPTIHTEGDVVNLYDSAEVYALIFMSSDFTKISNYFETKGYSYRYADLITKGEGWNEWRDGELEMPNALRGKIEQMESSIESNSSINPTFTFAVNLADYSYVMDILKKKRPQDFANITNIFIIPDSLLNLTNPVEFEGRTIYKNSTAVNSTYKFNINKWMFDYDEKYRDITKLYTSPYAVVSIKDPKGRTVDLRIQDLGDEFSATTMLNLLLPNLDLKVVFNGVGGSNKFAINHIYSNIDGHGGLKIAEYEFSQWNEMIFDFSVPTMVAYSNPSSDIDTKNSILALEARKFKAQKEVDMSIVINRANSFLSRFTNTMKTTKSAAVSFANSSRSALNSLNTTEDGAEMSRLHSSLSIDLNDKNQYKELDRVSRVAVLQRELAVKNLRTSKHTASENERITNNLTNGSFILTNDWTQALHDYNHKDLGTGLLKLLGGAVPTAAISDVIVGSGDVRPNQSELPTAGVVGGGERQDSDKPTVPGLPTLPGSQLVNQSFSSSSGPITVVSKEIPQRQSSGMGSNDIMSWGIEKLLGLAQLSWQEKYDQNMIDQSVMKNQLLINYGQQTNTAKRRLSNRSAENSLHDNFLAAEMIENLNTNVSTQKIEDNTYLSNQKASDIYQRALDNAYNQWKVTTTNNSLSNDLTFYNLDIDNRLSEINKSNTDNISMANLRNKLGDIDIDIALLKSKLNNNKISNVGGTSNTFLAKFGMMAIGFSIKTLDKSSVSEIGDYFLKYGYSSPIEVKAPNLNLMTGFTFWKFSDINIMGGNINESDRTILKEMFTRGVTIYNNPELVGNVSIYENGVIRNG